MSASVSRNVASTSTRASLLARARWRSSTSVGASAQCPSSSTSSSGRRRPAPARRSVTAVCSRWRSVSGSAATGARQPTDASGQVGKQAGQLAARAAELRTEHVGVGDAGELVERLGEGTVGRVHHGVAGAVEHEHPFARRPRAPTPAQGGSSPSRARRPAARADRALRPRAEGARAASSSSAERPTNGEGGGSRRGPGSCCMAGMDASQI